MLKGSDYSIYNGVYIVCGYTDLRYGIDSLAAIIQNRYEMNLFIPNTLFLFCGRSASKIKGLLWEGDGFLLLYKRVEAVILPGRETLLNSGPSPRNSSSG